MSSAATELGEQRARASLVVRPEHRQPSGTVHSGVYAALAERLTVGATASAVAADRQTGAPLSSQMSFLRPITEGVIHAVAVARHRGRTTWVWEVEFADDQGQLCVLARITIAVRDAAMS